MRGEAPAAATAARSPGSLPDLVDQLEHEPDRRDSARGRSARGQLRRHLLPAVALACPPACSSGTKASSKMHLVEVVRRPRGRMMGRIVDALGVLEVHEELGQAPRASCPAPPGCGRVRWRSRIGARCWSRSWCRSPCSRPAPSRRAVRMEARSEPESGSLIPMAKESSPRAMGGRKRSRCSSVPKRSRSGPALAVRHPVRAHRRTGRERLLRAPHSAPGTTVRGRRTSSATSSRSTPWRRASSRTRDCGRPRCAGARPRRAWAASFGGNRGPPGAASRLPGQLVELEVEGGHGVLS